MERVHRIYLKTFSSILFYKNGIQHGIYIYSSVSINYKTYKLWKQGKNQ